MPSPQDRCLPRDRSLSGDPATFPDQRLLSREGQCTPSWKAPAGGATRAQAAFSEAQPSWDQVSEKVTWEPLSPSHPPSEADRTGFREGA